MDDSGEERVSEVRAAEVIETPWAKNPTLTKRRAWELYMLSYWEKEELLELGMPEATLNTWLYQPTEESLSWKQERDLFERSVRAKMKDKAAESMSDVFSRGMSILGRSYVQADMEGMSLKKPREFKEMIEGLTKLKNLIDVEEAKMDHTGELAELTKAEFRRMMQELAEEDPIFGKVEKGHN